MLQINHLSTDISGLKYQPSFEDKSLNSLDGFAEYDQFCQEQNPLMPLYHGPIDFTENNHRALLEIMTVKRPNVIVEIGVDRESATSSTRTILSNKLDTTTYIGIDLRDISYLEDPYRRILTLSKTSSFNRDALWDLMNFNLLPWIDLLVIDGHHSIDAVLQDWEYTQRMPSGGIILFHDINHHPGPREIFEAIDENLYGKMKTCPYDYGLGIVVKR